MQVLHIANDLFWLLCQFIGLLIVAAFLGALLFGGFAGWRDLRRYRAAQRRESRRRRHYLGLDDEEIRQSMAAHHSNN